MGIFGFKKEEEEELVVRKTLRLHTLDAGDCGVNHDFNYSLRKVLLHLVHLSLDVYTKPLSCFENGLHFSPPGRR